MIVDFPEPVDPTMATDFPAGTLKLKCYIIIFCSFGGSFLS